MDDDLTFIPVCKALIKPSTILGVSREAMILNCTLAVLFIYGLKLWYTFPLFFITHYLLLLVCKKDPQIVMIYFKDFIKQQDYLSE